MKVFCRIGNIRGLYIRHVLVLEWFYDRGDAITTNTNLASPRQLSELDMPNNCSL